MTNKKKTIIQIKKGEFLLDIMDNGVKTTYKRKSALDVSNMPLEQVKYIIENLKKVGYTTAKVVFAGEVAENE